MLVECLQMEPATGRTAAELDYGLPVPLRRRKRVHRWLLTGAVGLVLVVVLANPRTVWNRAVLIYWQRQCLSYSLPADRPVGTWGEPKCYSKFAAAFGQGLSGDVLFLHQMEGSFGPRLVCVKLDSAATVKSGHPCLYLDSFRLISLGDDARQWHTSSWSDQRLPPDTKFFCGQLDPADPKHLTIRYEAGGRHGTIDGRLIFSTLWLQLHEDPTTKP
jgi:hypothetical protein